MKLTLLATAAMGLLAYTSDAGSYDPPVIPQVAPAALTCSYVANELRGRPSLWHTDWGVKHAAICGLTKQRYRGDDDMEWTPLGGPGPVVVTPRPVAPITCTTRLVENSGQEPRFERVTVCDGDESRETISEGQYLAEGGE